MARDIGVIGFMVVMVIGNSLSLILLESLVMGVFGAALCFDVRETALIVLLCLTIL